MGPIRQGILSTSRDFNPPIPCGMGPNAMMEWASDNAFQSTHPVWDGTYASIASASFRRFQSTHPVWDGTVPSSPCTSAAAHFNPPIPCGMGLNRPVLRLIRDGFQSTHPVWDGTFRQRVGDRFTHISIHPSRVGWDDPNEYELGPGTIFQSTHPVWDGTLTDATHDGVPFISIHPSRVGWDVAYTDQGFSSYFISIHPSRVGWDAMIDTILVQNLIFQSTHPVWDGTFFVFTWIRSATYFNPPIPCGMGLLLAILGLPYTYFNPPIPCGMGRTRLSPSSATD